MQKRSLFAAIAAVAVFATAASAAWWIDGEGKGFVGKGDVQTALGLNNKELQAIAENLTFYYEDAATYAVTCTKELDKKELTKTFNRKRGISSSVDYSPRSRNQVNGFDLTGFLDEDSVDFGTTNPCGTEGDPVASGWTMVGEPELIGSTSGILYVNDAPIL
jgi:hypothetical protein